jgi:hypothetical protein
MGSTYMERFAFQVDSMQKLEPSVSAALARHLTADESVQMIVVAPRQNRLGKRDATPHRRRALLPWRLTPAWVLILTTHRLIVATITQPAAEPLVTVIPTSALVRIEMGAVLLKGWLEFAWVDDQQMRHLCVHFNTVAERHFWCVLHALCSDLSSGIQSQSDTAEHNRVALQPLPFKFRGITASHLLLPGERLESVVYQPTIWRAHLVRLRRQQASAKMLALSNLHLLVAQEERSNEESCYGIIARYFPRSRLLGVEVQPSERSLVLKVRAGLGQAWETHAFEFSPDAKVGLDALLEQVNGSAAPKGLLQYGK